MLPVGDIGKQGSGNEEPKENITIYIVDSEQDKSLTFKWLTDAIEKSHTVIVSSKDRFKILKTDSKQDLEGIFNE